MSGKDAAGSGLQRAAAGRRGGFAPGRLVLAGSAKPGSPSSPQLSGYSGAALRPARAVRARGRLRGCPAPRRPPRHSHRPLPAAAAMSPGMAAVTFAG